MKNSVNIGIIGLGCRGSSMAEVMIKMDDINVLAVCDKYPDRVENTIKKIVSKGRPAPMGTTDYNDILNMPGIDTVYIATDWECHVKIAIEAMKKGIPAAMEVGGAYTLDECWELVDTYEETGVWTMMMENCCYGEREMMVHNMVREGVFGDIVFCSGQRPRCFSFLFCCAMAKRRAASASRSAFVCAFFSCLCSSRWACKACWERVPIPACAVWRRASRCLRL